MISAILLAAGEAKRMGKPKQLMPLGEKSILEHSLDNLLASRVNEIIVVVGCEAEAVAKKVAARPVRIAVNPDYKQGMSTSLVKGLDLVSDGAKAVMVFLADQPFIGSHVINQLIDDFANHKKGIAVPVYKGKRGHPIIFAIKYGGELSKLTGDAGAKAILKKHPEDVLEVDTGSEDIHRDIDDMKSYEREKNKIRSTKSEIRNKHEIINSKQKGKNTN
ncbi:MAG: nucleotidyltransferase family protein [Dehalococcoidales bacterium]|nr:nucleotidyltransferase family protein [Dehalococcoidales bacterium]